MGIGVIFGLYIFICIYIRIFQLVREGICPEPSTKCAADTGVTVHGETYLSCEEDEGDEEDEEDEEDGKDEKEEKDEEEEKGEKKKEEQKNSTQVLRFV